MDRVLAGRRLALQTQCERAEREFGALRESWICDSNSWPQTISNDDEQFTRDLKAILRRHEQLLILFQDDVDKFLFAAPIRLAKFEADYSWKLEEALGKEVDSVLGGILHGRHWIPNSIGYIARCFNEPSHLYSRTFLAAELRQRFYERRSAPRPGFQLTLEYARSLDGIAFEDWLTRLLRDAGIPGVCKTQASRDQGADIVITIGTRKIVVQAKNYQDTTGNKSVQEALGALHYYDANEAWVVTTSTFSTDAIDLSLRTGVHLIDGSRLLNLPDLLCGSGQTGMALSAGSDDLHIVETLEPPESVLPISQTEPERPNLLDRRDLEREGQNSSTSEIIPARFQFQGVVGFLRNQRMLGLGLAAIVLLALLTTFLGVSREENERKRKVQASSEHGVRGLLDTYLDAERSRNPQLLAECYAPTVETFYLRQNVSRNDVLREFQRAFAVYEDVHAVTISRISFSDVSETRATATFDKEWDLRGTKNYAGAEREQMTFQKIDGNWRISSERELKIYWTRHKNT